MRTQKGIRFEEIIERLGSKAPLSESWHSIIESTQLSAQKREHKTHHRAPIPETFAELQDFLVPQCDDLGSTIHIFGS